jgi:acyl-CoA synthetase (AMP-forming)/AMP-acid ligase II
MSASIVPGGSTTLAELVAERAARTPEHPMLVDEYDRRLTSAGYRHAVEAVAAGLLARGVRPGTRVSWQLPTTLESVVLMGALARLGAVQNPLITVLRAGELRPILADVRPALIVVPTVWRDHHHARTARELAVDIGAEVLTCDACPGPLDLPTGDPATLPPPPAGADGRRWIYTSSGSTARPKTIWHTDRSVLASANASVGQLPIASEDLFPVAFPFAHIGGVSWLVTALRTGCRLLLVAAFDPVAGPALMARHGATILGSATPFLLAYLSAQQAHGTEPLFDRLRFCMGGGAALPRGLHARVRAELGGLGMFNGYGLTEAPILGYPAPDDPDELVDASAFRPAPGVEVGVLDVTGAVLPHSEQGELAVRGPQSFAGYLDPALTADVVGDDGFLRTGDLGVRRPSGHIVVTGRVKDVIVRNGENISGAEIEAALLTLPAVAEVAVVGLPDERRGERVGAVVVPADAAAPPSLDDLVAACAAAGLARFKHPEEMVLRDHLPRSPMGKLVKPAILADVTGVVGTPVPCATDLEEATCNSTV